MAKIQLYSLATPNGQKVSIALEEMGIDYDAHTINIMKDDQFTDHFKSINPNSKIPAIVDPEGPESNHPIMESGAILLYLAQKSGKFLSTDPVEKSNTLQWLFFQMGGVGPMFGQFGHFYKYAKDKCDHPYPVERYTKEAKRLLAVIDQKLSKTKYIATDEYSIADMSIYPWILCLDKFYEASDTLELSSFKNIQVWKSEIDNRKATQAGLDVCPFN